jgi:hypothetical protein
MYVLESRDREATASVHRTQLAVVRRIYKSTKFSRVTPKGASDQTRPADT